MVVERVRFTENFSTNLTDMEEFLGEEGASYFSKFFQRLLSEVVPNLQRFPRSGRSFLDRSVLSIQAVELSERLQALLQTEDDLRELIVDDCVLLYLMRHDELILLSIKHHNQLSFDLKKFWRG